MAGRFQSVPEVKWSASVMLLVVVGFASGCNRGVAPVALPQALMQKLLERWETTADRPQLVEDFIALGLSAPSATELRSFALSEPQYRSLDAAQRDQQMGEYLKIGSALRGLARTAIERAQSQVAAGDIEGAMRTLDAVERIAQADDREDVVLLGRMIAQSILSAVEKARNAIAQAMPDPE